MGDSFPLYSTVTKWTNEFKSGWEDLEDDQFRGQSRYATNPEIILKVHNIALEDHQLKLLVIPEATATSSEWIHHILTDKLGVKKISVR